VRNIDPAPIADIANNSICLSLGWSGDMEAARSRANEAKTGANIAYFVPREGSVITVDMLSIPARCAASPQRRNMDELLDAGGRDGRPSRTYIHYPNWYSASLPLVQASVKNDDAVYPDQATLARLISPKTVPLDYSRLLLGSGHGFVRGN